jgi:OOP family OmpA-OmpF porin
LAGTLFNTSLGLTFYLGKNDKHADWTFKEEGWNNATDKMAQARLDNIETLMNDTDKDGVPDYLDAQNNTPNGVAVDTKGRFIDTNKNGTPDELEPRSAKDGKDGAVIVNKEDALKTLIEKGYINVFYDINKDTPNSGSTNNVYHIINYLRQYPTANAVLTGYADVRGNEASNQDLSNRRAQKLYDVIIASGIDATRVTIKAEGVDTSYPNTKTGLDLARRVSITIQ